MLGSSHISSISFGSVPGVNTALNALIKRIFSVLLFLHQHHYSDLWLG